MPEDDTLAAALGGRAIASPHEMSAGKSQAEKSFFPGALKLNMKRLRKGRDMEEYQSLFSLRYQVYCHEAHFLDPADYPLGLEMDEFDEFSEHFLAKNANSSGDAVGTVRLVRWSDNLSFPTADHYRPLLAQLENLKFPLDTTAEISRLCISRQFRKRARDGVFGVEGYDNGGDPRRKYPVVILELFKIMYRNSKNGLGITHWIATFEDGLYRLLSRYGVRFEQITSEEIEYYGKVKIYGAPVAYLEETVRATHPALYEYFCRQPEPHAASAGGLQ